MVNREREVLHIPWLDVGWLDVGWPDVERPDVERPDGTAGDYHVVRLRDLAVVAAVDDCRVLMMWRHRIAQSCGLAIDLDANAAINLRNLVAASTSETQNARGADRRTHASGQVAVKREPGTATATATAGQTRGAPPKGEAA